jgi:accessory gene regulator protein AgrB
MANQEIPYSAQEQLNNNEHDEKSLNEMLQELRVLQQGSQILAGFLVLLPFSEGFAKIAAVEKWVYIVAFVTSIISLICFSAPAAQHRLARPLKHRVKFKRRSTRIIVAGTVALSITLISTTHLVLNEVVGRQWSHIGTALIGVLIGIIWWLIPLLRQGRG